MLVRSSIFHPDDYKTAPKLTVATAAIALDYCIIDRPAGVSLEQFLGHLAVLPAQDAAAWEAVLRARLAKPIPPVCPCGSTADISLGDGSRSCPACGLTGSDWLDAIGSPVFRAAADRKLEGIREGQDTVVAMRQILGPIAQACDSAVLVDRYFAQSALSFSSNSSSVKDSGAYKLCQMLDQYGISILEVHTYAKLSQAEDAKSAIRECAGLMGNLRLNVKLYNENTFKNSAHDRSITFTMGREGRVAISIGKGVQSFDGVSAPQAYSASLQRDSLLQALLLALEGREHSSFSC